MIDYNIDSELLITINCNNNNCNYYYFRKMFCDLL